MYGRVAFIYANRELYDYANEYMKKANEYALLSQNSYYIVSSYNSIARLYSAKKNYVMALEYYDKAIKLGENNNEVKLVNNALQEKIFILAKVKRYDEALLISDILKKKSKESQTHLALGYFYTELNQSDSAYFYLNKASKSNNIYTQRSSYQALFNLSKKLNDYEKNSIYTIKLWNVQDSINKIDKKKILIEMQEKYNQQKIINKKNKAEKRGLIILCVSIGIISIIVVTYQRKVLHQSKMLNKKEKELTDFVNQLNENKQVIAQNKARIKELEGKEELSTEMQKEKERSIDEMQKQNKSLENKNKDLLLKIDEYTANMAEKSKEIERLRILSDKNLYLHKRELFLCNELLKKEEFVNKIKKNPRPLDAIQWRDIMSKADAIYDNYTIRLRTRIPELTENDIRICCLIKLSFNNGDIAKILGISPTSVSRQKLRLKERIIQQIGSLGENILLDIWLKEF